MNFQLVILLCVVACALSLPLPDEEAATLIKTEPVPNVLAAVTDGSVKPSTEQQPIALTSAAGSSTTEKATKPETETKVAKPTEGSVESTSIPDDSKSEEPKSLPVTAREGTAVVPLFAGARVEPKEGVEVGESKSSASSPNAEDTQEKSEAKPTETVQLTSENPIAGSIPKQDSSASSEEKPKSETPVNKPSEGTEKKPVAKPEGEKKSESSTTPKAESKESDKSSQVKTKSSESSKEKHEHSSEQKKADDSAESKESDESNESSNTQ